MHGLGRPASEAGLVELSCAVSILWSITFHMSEFSRFSRHVHFLSSNIDGFAVVVQYPI